jgi:16S rRNA (guanine966-N2)-methyltransferase
MRIISGICKGHRLASLKGRQTRPTQDRVREAIFNILEPKGPFQVVADLFAGSGALGLEALSRWGGTGLFVDSSRAALDCIRENILRLKFEDRAQGIHRDLAQGADFLIARKRPFDLIFMDPPYGQGWSALIIPKLLSLPILEEKGILVLEHDQTETPPPQVGRWIIGDERRYGRTRISFYNLRIKSNAPMDFQADDAESPENVKR